MEWESLGRGEGRREGERKEKEREGERKEGEEEGERRAEGRGQRRGEGGRKEEEEEGERKEREGTEEGGGEEERGEEMESKGYVTAATKPRNLDQGSTSTGAGSGISTASGAARYGISAHHSYQSTEHMLEPQYNRPG